MISDYCMCNIGLRQGDNLSPVLFALFINDFTEYVSTAYGGLNIAQSCCPSLMNSEDIASLKLFVLLYADDTIILAENEIELQLALNKVYEYCMMFKLSVNRTKPKKLVFPIMLYGCETWGAQPQDMLEIFYRKLKIISHLRPSTPSYMVYGEVGILPLQVTNDTRIMSLWLRLLNKEESSLAHIVFMIAHNLFVRHVYNNNNNIYLKSNIQCI